MSLPQDLPPNAFYRVSAKALCIARGGLLVIEDQFGGFELPGGGVDWGEDPVDALARELKEELGVTAHIDPVPCGCTTYRFDASKLYAFHWTFVLFFRATCDSHQFKHSPESLSAHVVPFEDLSRLNWTAPALGEYLARSEFLFVRSKR